MTRTSKVAYLAALIDSDGFIGLDDGVLYELRHCIKTGITSRKVCKFLQLHFGGNFHRVPREDGEKTYYWKLTGSQAVPNLLRELLPFLTVHLVDAQDTLGSADPVKHTLNRRELAAYQAGYIDTKGFDCDVPYGGTNNTEGFFLSVLPYLVERKAQVNGMLQTLRSSGGLPDVRKNGNSSNPTAPRPLA